MAGPFNLILFTLCCAATAMGQTKPLAEREKWSYGDPSAWEWSDMGDDTVLALKKPSAFKPKVRSPFNLAWYTGGHWDSFTLTAEVKLDLFNGVAGIPGGSDGRVKSEKGGNRGPQARNPCARPQAIVCIVAISACRSGH